MTDFKKDIKYVQERVLKAVQYTSRLIMNTGESDEKINENIDGLCNAMEHGVITARTIMEKYRPKISSDESGKEQLTVMGAVAGEIELTPEMWTHIKLNTLLPHCKYKSTTYLQDTIIRLLENYPGKLPKYDKAFLAIVEHCNIQTRNAYDQDNKGWTCYFEK